MDFDREENYGPRTITSLRWEAGKLQYCVIQKFSRFEGRRLVQSGEKEVWIDVEGEMPFPIIPPPAA